MNKRLIAIIFVIAIHLQIATSSNEKTTSRLIKKESRLRNERNLDMEIENEENTLESGIGSGSRSNSARRFDMGVGRRRGLDNEERFGIGNSNGGSNNIRDIGFEIGSGLNGRERFGTDVGNDNFNIDRAVNAGDGGGSGSNNIKSFGVDQLNKGLESDFGDHHININIFKIVRSNDPENMVYAATIYEESKGEGFLDMLAVASVIRTRVLKNQPWWGGNQIRSVCTHPNQFSAWKNGVIEIRDVPKFKRALAIVDKITKNEFIDPTDGADNYNIWVWAKDIEKMSSSFLKGKSPLINKVKSLFSLTSPSTTAALTMTSASTTSSSSSSSSTTTKATSQSTTTQSSAPTTTTTTKAPTTTTKAPTTTTTTTKAPTTATTATSTTTKAASTTTTSSSGSASTTAATNVCTKGDGYYADLASGCAKYYKCMLSGTSHKQVYYFNCPTGLLFDSSLNVCNYAASVVCA